MARLGRSERIIGASAIAFFIFLFFFKWYGGSASLPGLAGQSSVSNSYSGWHTFTNSRWIWLITIIVALGEVAISAGVFELRTPVQLSVIVTGLGALSVLLILYRIIHHPSGGASISIPGAHYSYSYGIKIGIWLGLIAAAGVTYGGYAAMTAQGTSLGDVREQAASAVAAARESVQGSGESTAAAQGEAPSPQPPSEPGPPIPPPSSPES